MPYLGIQICLRIKSHFYGFLFVPAEGLHKMLQLHFMTLPFSFRSSSIFVRSHFHKPLVVDGIRKTRSPCQLQVTQLQK
jgi:hypothetical protein